MLLKVYFSALSFLRILNSLPSSSMLSTSTYDYHIISFFCVYPVLSFIDARSSAIGRYTYNKNIDLEFIIDCTIFTACTCTALLEFGVKRATPFLEETTHNVTDEAETNPLLNSQSFEYKEKNESPHAPVLRSSLLSYWTISFFDKFMFTYGTICCFLMKELLTIHIALDIATKYLKRKIFLC